MSAPALKCVGADLISTIWKTLLYCDLLDGVFTIGFALPVGSISPTAIAELKAGDHVVSISLTVLCNKNERPKNEVKSRNFS